MAETARLRKLQQPSHIERLLTALVMRAHLVPDGAYQIRHPRAVPRDLRKIATHATEKGRVWSCWADGLHTWLFTGEMSLPRSRERGAPVVQVDLYNDDGSTDSGLWTPNSDGGWQRCTN
ncbi:MAG: hypothetical protein WA747_12295 [Steroidobacteraceae bacterium]